MTDLSKAITEARKDMAREALPQCLPQTDPDPMQPVDPMQPPQMRTDKQGRRLCTGTTRQGNPCKAPSLTGAMVCRMHGGSSPQVREKAHHVVLEELVGPALMTLRGLIEDEATPPAVRLGAARDIRTGPAIKHRPSSNGTSSHRSGCWMHGSTSSPRKVADPPD